jgi:hypothetical protein
MKSMKKRELIWLCIWLRTYAKTLRSPKIGCLYLMCFKDLSPIRANQIWGCLQFLWCPLWVLSKVRIRVMFTKVLLLWKSVGVFSRISFLKKIRRKIEFNWNSIIRSFNCKSNNKLIKCFLSFFPFFFLNEKVLKQKNITFNLFLIILKWLNSTLKVEKILILYILN